jgi:hypothetical protein
MGLVIDLGEMILKAEDELVPGDIIEAASFSSASCLGKRVPRKKDPTGIFAYVRGTVADCEIERFFSYGATVVTRALPSGSDGPDYVERWANRDASVKAYIVVGRIAKNSGFVEEDLLTGHLSEDSISLSSEEIESLRRKLVEYSSERPSGNVVFKAPEARTYTLNEILLQLEEES